MNALTSRPNTTVDHLNDLLSTSTWTRHLSSAQLQRVSAATSIRFFPAGSYVCRVGEPAEYWAGVIEGLVKVCAVSPSGKETTFIGVTKGGWFGEGSLLKNEPRRHDSIAVRDCIIACVPRSTFHWLLEQSIPFNHAVIAQINERLKQVIDLVVSDRLFEPNARVASCLASLYHPRLCPIVESTLSISQEEIGCLAGLSRQRVNYALKALESHGVLKIEAFGVTVPDPEQLRRFVVPDAPKTPMRAGTTYISLARG